VSNSPAVHFKNTFYSQLTVSSGSFSSLELSALRHLDRIKEWSIDLGCPPFFISKKMSCVKYNEKE